MMYSFRAQHIPGPLNFVADATSRNPATEGRSFLTSLADVNDTFDSEAEELHTAMVNAVRASDDAVVTWDQVKMAASKDAVSSFTCAMRSRMGFQ